MTDTIRKAVERELEEAKAKAQSLGPDHEDHRYWLQIAIQLEGTLRTLEAEG